LTFIENTLAITGSEPVNTNVIDEVNSVTKIRKITLIDYSWDGSVRMYYDIPFNDNILIITLTEDLYLFDSLRQNENSNFDLFNDINNTLNIYFTDEYNEGVSNDPLSIYQANLKNNLNPDFDLDIEKAWDLATNTEETIVAVIDGGMQINHEDLEGQFWVNEDEVPNNNIDDDDGNGYIDDINGYNVTNNTGQFSSDHHGVWVTGVIAATKDNSIGMAGICPACKIMFVDFEINGGPDSFNTAKALQALDYAHMNGAQVINASWFFISYSAVIEDKINELYADGILTIAAAANTNSDPSADSDSFGIYPAMYENVVAVSAINQDGYKSIVSSYGDWVDISGMSYNIVTTNTGDSDYSPPYPISSSVRGKYGTTSGSTSLATPNVTGVTGILLSINPNLTSQQQVEILKNSANELPQQEFQLGVGSVNAGSAVEYLLNSL